MMLRRTLTLAAFGLAVAGGAQAQTAAENRDADALAADMRLLAANPLDIEALVTAGELTLRLGDPTAAAGFFGRAEKLDPLNPRIKAGWGSLMVRAERPGEALARFQEAERRGLDPRRFAGDRGLAYDLIGEQDRAQRDYRAALLAGPDDEVTRRYALSLGISGRKDDALRLLDPLLRRSDRAAWRDRAFILAMNGDAGGAEKIAASMMSPGLGAGLTPFFRKLPQLSAVDRAFAVSFGELRSTPERVADARLVPSLPRLGPDPTAPRVVAVALPVVARPVEESGERKKRRRGDLAPAVALPAAAAPVEVALATPRSAPPRVVPTPTPTPAPTPASPPPRVAAVVPTLTPAPARVIETPTPAAASAPPPAAVAAATPTPAPAPTPSPAPTQAVDTPTPAPASSPAGVATAAPSPPPPPENPAPTPAIAIAAAAPVAAPSDPEPGVADQPSAAEAGVPEQTATARVSEDTVLARIVANLGKSPPERTPAPQPRRVSAPLVTPKTEEVRAKPVDEPRPGARIAETRTRGKSTKGDETDAKPATGKGKELLADAGDTKRKAGKTAKDDAPALDRNGCPIPVKATIVKGKVSVTKDKPTATTRGKSVIPARCKAADAKDKADAASKGEPARVWVQVAGGANEASLEKAWAGLRAKAPDLFRNRQGWSTPLRATNRVLTGPFTSVDEAQDFVNRMSKAGLSGFVFTSAKGQKIDRLGSK